MKTALLLALLGANGVAFALITSPGRRELGELKRQTEDLEEAHIRRSIEVDQWEELQALVRLAASRFSPTPTQGKLQLSVLQGALLEAERGLAIRRSSMDIRLDSEVPVGFRGYRIDMETTGDFANIYQYLYRVSRLPVPLRLSRMQLTEDPASALRLTATWVTLWPDS
jgi:hypothetical protein